MKNLNICIDIDGTITDAYYWLDMCNEYFGKSLKESDVTEYDIIKVLNVTEDEYYDFYEKNKFRLHSEQKIRQDAKIFINKLNRFHNIYFVTARDKNLTLLTRAYLKRNGIPCDGLYVLGSHYKVKTARELGCSVFIEDNYDNAIQLSSEGFRVLLIDTNYNKGPLNENITRVNGWDEIYTIINKLILQSEAM